MELLVIGMIAGAALFAASVLLQRRITARKLAKAEAFYAAVEAAATRKHELEHPFGLN